MQKLAQKKILLIAGTRPNFIKLAPLYHRLKGNEKFKAFICHTGQHFDFNMSDIFWENLELPEPDFRLDIKGEDVADTIGKTILGINGVIKANQFDLVVVFGDVNATVAGAITAAQSGIKLMHVESGLRSFDRSMPEEINRVITDHIADYLMVSEPSGIKNLEQEGFSSDKYRLVGNIMIESLLRTKHKWENIVLPEDISALLVDKPVVFTFHRPENVDKENDLKKIVELIIAIAGRNKTIFPVHPRTRAKLIAFDLYKQLEVHPDILISEPMSYFSFLKVISNAGFIITDSGGIQEESSFLRIPCITFRNNTERPVTIDDGTNILLNINDDHYLEKIYKHVDEISTKKASIPFWDNEVSKRIVDFLETKF